MIGNSSTRSVASTILVLLVVGCVSARLPGGERPTEDARRCVFLVGAGAEPSWHDFAFLAAVPAATVANSGRPAILALGPELRLSPEVQDYLKRYQPRVIYALGGDRATEGERARRWRKIEADSAEAAALALADRFWRSSTTVVLCRDDDYASALTASALAGRLRAPLLFAHRGALSTATLSRVRRLGASRALVVGSAEGAATALERAGLRVSRLPDARSAIAWMRGEKMSIRYFALANPRDRRATVIKKLSLAAPILAVARGGAVVPLAYETLWKAPFEAKEVKGRPPAGAGPSKKPPRRGTISLGQTTVDFILTTGKRPNYWLARFDLNRNGNFADKGEGPFKTADTLALAGKTYSLTVGGKKGKDQNLVRLTYPSAERILDDLRAYYSAAGSPPEYLCIVGLPDAIPQAIVRHSPNSEQDLLSDFPFANTDGDLFAEVAVARLIAEDVASATLYASRVITYDDLLDPSWCERAGQARWENTYAKLFENVGFSLAPHHDVDDLKWLEPPAPGKKGKRAREFDQSSPLTSVAVLTHMAHSWWKDLGQTYTWDSQVLLAPVLVESGGCLTAALDRQPDFRSVVSRLLRNGAVGFVGNARPGIACQEQLRLEFWNGVLAGLTIGQAHRRAQNSMVVTVLETGQAAAGGDRYSLYIRSLFGDPALAIHIPSAPRSGPARLEVKGNAVSVYAPEQWWPVRIRVPEDWKKWKDKPLYVLRGAGTYPHRHWIGEGYDREETYVNAWFHTARKVARIEQVESPPKPLGWAGKFVVDEHADGTRTYWWRVRVADFDQTTGKLLKAISRLDYRIVVAE